MLNQSENPDPQQKGFLVKHKEIHYFNLLLPACQVRFKGTQIKGVCEKENNFSDSAQSDC